MKRALPAEQWREFQATVVGVLRCRFGDTIQIRTVVNFAVDMTVTLLDPRLRRA